MKRLIITLIFATISVGYAVAQEADSLANEKQVIYIDRSGANTLSAEDDGSMLLTINGMRLKFGGSSKSSASTSESDNSKPKDSITYESKRKRARIGLCGLGSPRYNHFALFELGKNFLVNESYPGYSAEELSQMEFTTDNATYLALNFVELNVALDKSCRFAYSMSLGLSYDEYSFREKVTLDYQDGRFYPITLDSATKKSKLHACYLHIPMVFDWNIDKNFFISAGVTFDVLISSYLQYKKPRTTIEGTMPLNPVQFGITGRIGWKRIYGFVNYSPTNFYKRSTGVRASKMSAGVGIWF